MSTLYLVATPIGNLKDITLRALETLESVDYIACEDTRHTLKLLNHFEIRKPLVSYFKDKENEKSEEILTLLFKGKNIALVSDAGMPVISDPGAVLVKKAKDAGHVVTVVPGASALTCAVALQEREEKGFIFLGFLPEKKKDKENLLKSLINSPLPLVFYVAPHDMEKNIKFLLEYLGDREAFFAREITKLYEETKSFRLSEYEGEARGEYVLIVYPEKQENVLNSLSVKDHLLHYINLGTDKKTAVKKVAEERGILKNEVYQIGIDLEIQSEQTEK